MRIFFFSLLACFAAPFAACAESAYQALRALASARGDATLSRVIEVIGRSGDPQPAKWKIVVSDDTARGGIREFEIAGGAIVSERAPTRNFESRTNGTPMDFTVLNLDSSGAFTVAEGEAVEKRIGFDKVDYMLAADAGGRPVWTLELIGKRARVVATLDIAADDGKVLAMTTRAAESGPAPEEPLAGQPLTKEEAEAMEDDSFKGKLHRFGDKVESKFRRAGGSLQKFFTGKRTIDRDVETD